MKYSVVLRTPKNYFIKRLRTILLLFPISLVGCNKGNPDPVNTNVHNEFTVVETNSNTPIPGVTVNAYSSGGLYTATTNDSGKVSFDTHYGIGSLRLSKEKYWPGEYSWAWTFIGPPSRVELTPIATLKVHYTRVNQYRQGYLLNLRPSTCYTNANVLKQLQPASSSGTVYLKGAGNCGNSVGWAVDTLPKYFTQGIMINRFDTAEFVIEY
jgi:hypothetical protein